MKENDLKRNLIKSIRAQEGEGNRFEDKFSVGFPDCLFIPDGGPCFFTEVKLIRSGNKLVCTALQEVQLDRLHRPQRKGVWYAHGVIVAYHLKREVLYIGRPGETLDQARYCPRPKRLESPDWPITELLIKYDLGRTNTVALPSREDIAAMVEE